MLTDSVSHLGFASPCSGPVQQWLQPRYMLGCAVCAKEKLGNAMVAERL